MPKTRPPFALEFKATKARKSVLHIYVSYNKVDDNGEEKKTGSTGTGFIIRSSNKGSIIMTAAHVIKNTEKDPQSKIYLRQMIPSGRVKQVEATILYADSLADVAILKSNALKEASSLQFSSTLSTALKINQCAVAIGYSNPHGLLNTPALIRLPAMSPGEVKKGKQCQYTNAGATMETILVSCVTMEGMSGGPLLDMKGVIGMVLGGKEDKTIAICNDTISSVFKAYLQHPLDSQETLEELISQLL